MPKFDHRFARQNGGGPPPEFPLASSYPGIVHHLSGPNIYALTRVFQEISRSVRGAHSRGPTLFLLSFRDRVCHPNTRIHVRLLGPCFKTGRLIPFRQAPAMLPMLWHPAEAQSARSLHPRRAQSMACRTTTSISPHPSGL
jgi:hypothetical protein